MRKLVGAIALATLMAATAAAQERPRHEGWLADEARLLTSEEAASIRSSIATTKQTTGVTVAVLTLQKSNGVEPKAIAVDTLNAWNPGPRSAILVVVMNPRKLYLQPGSDLVQTFDPDTCAGLLKASVVPEMKAGRPFSALSGGLAAIEGRIKSTPAQAAQPRAAATSSSGPDPMTVVWVLLGSLLVLFVLVLIFSAVTAPARRSYQGTSYRGPSYSSPGYTPPAYVPPVYVPPVVTTDDGFSTGFLMGHMLSEHNSPPPPPAPRSSSYSWGGGGGSDSSSSSSSSYDSSPSSFDSGSSFSCDGGGGGGADF